MKRRSKRYRQAMTLVDRNKRYELTEAIETLKQLPHAKFDEALEMSFQLDIDASLSEQTVRGTVSLPHGSGKPVRVLCFCKGEEARGAEREGAEYVGGEELIQKVQGGWFDFDVVVAHPDMMREVSKLGRVLGPKGLMPSPKTGTVAKDVGQAVKEVKQGKIEIKSDKTGGLHVACGRISFATDQLVNNARAVVKAVLDHKPSGAKGDYLHKVAVSTTQSPGLKLEAKVLL